jgi:hypothetical protein
MSPNRIIIGNCVICSQPRLCSGYDTCGNSYCQEARNYLNRARNAKRPAAKREHTDRANAAIANRDLQLSRS